jgi:phage terminase large subunit-like protein
MLTRGEKVIKFIQAFCIIPEGDLAGQPVKLEDFQKKFILDLYDNLHITDTAILSIARKNAKTGIIAFLMLTHLVGPEAKLNSRIVSGAMSREQAAEVYNLASKCVMLSPKLTPLIKIIPSSKKMIGLMMNVEYQAISAEGKTAHGKSPILAILDEVGQVKGAQSDFIDAITTAQGAYNNPLLIYISTQAASDSDFFSILIDDAQKNKPPKTICHVYEADKDCDLLDEKQWYKANPALGKFRSLDDMRKQAEKASRMPTFENTFRNLNLNQRVNTISPFVSAKIWKNAQAEIVLTDFLDEECWVALDLSFTQDLTALAMIFKRGDIYYNFTEFWSPYETMFDREKQDRAPYTTWLKQGYIHKTEGKVIKLEAVGSRIAELLSDYYIKAIAYDNYRHKELAEDMQAMGIDAPFIEHPQGFRRASNNPLWMPSSIEKFETLLIEDKLKVAINPVLTMCASNCIVRVDPAGTGGKVFNKAKSTGRIDGMVAVAMAVGAAASNQKDGTVECNIRQL